MPNDESRENEWAQLGDEEREVISGLLRFCLQLLVDDGHVQEDELRSNFHIAYEGSDRLNSRGLAAATTQDDEGHAVLVVDPALPLDAIIWAIPHEAVHVAQVCRGDLAFLVRCTQWQGQSYVTLHAEHPDYLMQPWEAEAARLEHDLRAAMCSRYQELGHLVTCPPRRPVQGERR